MKNIVLLVFIFICSFLQCQTFSEIDAGLASATSGSVSWGDYDNDGDLDILMTGPEYSRIYRNDSGIFTDINAGLIRYDLGSSAWGDYDNDGDLDIILIGVYQDPEILGLFYYVSIIYRNDDGKFTNLDAGLTGVGWDPAVAWGDYDNDGDLDILLSGITSTNEWITRIYRNDSGIFNDINANLQGVSGGSANWGDYDNDGDLDILINGGYIDGIFYYVTNIYRNDSGLFTDVSAGLIGLEDESSTWGDYDNDGDLDVLLSGRTGANDYITRLYRNDSGVFTEVSDSGLPQAYGLVKWWDYDNDGDLDIIISGIIDDPGPYAIMITSIYRNDNGVFTDIDAGLTSIYDASIACGDFDNDGDLDILLTGNSGTKLYTNNNPIFNTNPTSPLNITSFVNGVEITFHWDKANDNETPQNGLSYNLYIGTESHTPDKMSPMSNISTGYRKIINGGNAGQSDTWTIKNLHSGTYYWSVQAIDHCFAGSEFAPEQTFIVTGIDEDILPSTTDLLQNYPNPFNPTTEIKLSLNQTQNIKLTVINSKGELIRTLEDGKKNKGLHTVSFDASGLDSGIYFYKLTIKDHTITRKMLFLK